MATRALIGHLSGDGKVFASTYNHYDGYPEGLGKALNTHYNSDDTAKKVANTGYISYIEDDGKINSKYDEKPDVTKFSGDFTEDDAFEIAELVDSYGGNYGYVWFDGEWHVLKNNGIRAMADSLMDKFMGGGTDPESDPQAGDFMNEGENEINEADYKAKWNQFINESKIIDSEWALYVKSLLNDIRLNGLQDYANLSEEDIIEDMETYISDRRSM